MPQWNTLQNTPITLDPNQLATDQGWTIAGTVAYHDGCFGGNIILRNIEVEAGKSYILEYYVKYYTTGEVNAIVGGVEGMQSMELGKVTEQFNVPEDATDLTIQFYSDGTLGVEYMQIYPVLENPINGVTLGFNAENNRWTSTYSFLPEFMCKFINQFVCFEDGRMWIQNSPDVPRNNFFGVQYTSQLTVVVNANPTEIKNFFAVRLKSTKTWEIYEITIPPSHGKSRGQLSRIKKGNFKPLNNGDWFAPFLRDMNTPNFGTELQALFNGALLQGNYMEMAMENVDVDEVRMLSIDVQIVPQQLTY